MSRTLATSPFTRIRTRLSWFAITALVVAALAIWSTPATAQASPGAASPEGSTAPVSAEAVEIMARPTGCRYELLPEWEASAAWCDHHNGGSYRGLVNCQDPKSKQVRQFVGDWRQVGHSYAYCQGSYTKPIAAGIETSVRNLS